MAEYHFHFNFFRKDAEICENDSYSLQQLQKFLSLYSHLPASQNHIDHVFGILYTSIHKTFIVRQGDHCSLANYSGSLAISVSH